ncbi:GNAT family N-acetyltransferase [Phytohabitans rumicis]|uniref:GNAT family N-acetyltransferase n=1 Tax=Phytohabitans rumicis TaxID=1076125 RepID=UPI001FE7AE4C|nr:GNAT family N-acetyltransferase [Phytohabitans rumicis]
MADTLISPVDTADVGEILTLQRAAYVTEAQLYSDASLPALTQTYEELAAELSSSLALKATMRHRIVGAVRGRLDGSVLHIGRLTVAPDLQGHGIGTRLLTALEREAAGDVDRYTLFTGHLSRANIRLYERHGYTEVRREELKPGVVLVHLDKQADK